jgi:ribose transport system ATP-binding protein
VTLEAAPGEVHAILGENGAGKSTLMRVLAGVARRDAGTIELDGVAYDPAGPAAARRAGVAMVHQEPMICADLTVGENVMLGCEPTRRGLVDRRALAARAAASLREVMGASAPDVDLPAARLGVGQRQLVGMARALAQGAAKVLILDEPTASLDAADAERLFASVARLRAEGRTILYVSHFLEEVRRVADRYTVLRDGCSVGAGAIGDVTAEELVEAIVGRRLERPTREARAPGDVILSVARLAGRGERPADATLELRRGEVLGVAGLVGAGRTELLRAIFALDPVLRGEVRVGVHGGPAARAARASPRRRLGQGLGLLSEDRKTEGLAQAMSIADNITLSRLDTLAPTPLLGRFGVLSPSRRRAAARRWVEALRIRCRDVDQPVSELSGGNQQKVALARLLHHDLDVLLLDEPTRGIDVGARADIERVVDELAARGKAALVVSSSFPELLATCDRIAVMHRGRLGPARPVSDLDEHTLVQEATGA